ncbi:MAG: hypothetical protein AB7O96_12225 [Pseudobdellovibrionaceae bacterium]
MNRPLNFFPKMFLIMVILSTALFTAVAEAGPKKRNTRKVQEVSFSDMDLKGTIRNPDGAYLVQKRGIRFMPLYDVQKDFDKRIRDSAYFSR